MKKLIYRFFICIAVISVSMIVKPSIVANAATGGEVVVSGDISFYEERSNSSTNNSSVGNGILPKTGEDIGKYSIVGCLLILLLLLYFLRGRREDDDIA